MLKDLIYICDYYSLEYKVNKSSITSTMDTIELVKNRDHDESIYLMTFYQRHVPWRNSPDPKNTLLKRLTHILSLK